MGLHGDVETVPLRDLLGWLALRNASGTLNLNRGKIARQFHLRGGQVMLSSSTDEEMLLGRLLVARGLIDVAQLASALDARPGSRRRLGSTLTRAGLISAAELRGVLTDKVRRLLLDALAWSDGSFSFDDSGTPPKPSGVSAIVALAEVLAMPPDIYAAVAPDDVVVTDDDIIEVADVAASRRPPPLRDPRRKTGSTRPAARRRSHGAGESSN